MLQYFSQILSLSSRWTALAALLCLALAALGVRPAGAQVTYDGGAGKLATYATTDFISPVAVDSAGDLFYVVQSGSTNTLYKDSVGSSPTVLNSAFPYLPTALAVNASGSALYFIYSGATTTCTATAGTVSQFIFIGTVSTAANSTPSTLPTCFSFGTPTPTTIAYADPQDLAVDSSGNLYVDDFGGGVIFKIPAPVTGSSFPTTQLNLNIQSNEMALYGSNVYFAALNASSQPQLYSSAASQFSSTTPSTSASSTSLVSVQSTQDGMAAGPNGEIYINGNAQIQEYNGGSLSTFDTLPTGTSLKGVGTDSSGTVYYSGSDSSGAPFVAKSGSPAENFASVAIGSSKTTNLPFTIGASGSTTVTSVEVLTEGATGKDFTDAGGSTCTAKTYTTSTHCTVNVKFAPSYAGSRRGAVVFLNGSTVLSTTYVYGTGTGPQVAFDPGAVSTFVSGLTIPADVAMDAAGNFYVVDNSASKVLELAPGCNNVSCGTSLGGGFKGPDGVAVDGAGNVYVGDVQNNAVKEMPPGCTSSSCVTTLGGGFNHPSGVAVDGAGNVYVADYFNNAVKEIPPGCTSSSCVTTLGGGFNSPTNVAVDGAGNVYVADFGNTAVKEIPVGCTSSSCVTTLGGGFSEPYGVAVDGAGNVYAGDFSNNAVYEIPSGCTSADYTAGSCKVTTLASGITNVDGLALDGAGNLYISPYGETTISELARATAPSLTFATTQENVQSSDSPQTVTVENIGNQTLTFPIPGSGSDPSVSTSFALDSTTTTCPQLNTSSGSAGTLSAGSSCIYGIDFIPKAIGSISGSAVLTDDSLNATSPYATQSIGLSGTSAAPVTQLAFGTAPAATITAGGNAGTITVDEEDSSGTTVTVATDTITLTVTGPNSYSKTYSQGAASGVASFSLSSVTLQTAGTYTYTATSTGYTSAKATETVNAAAASAISVVSGSGQSAAIGASFTSPLVVKVADSYGNGISGATVTFTAPGSGASATLSTPAKTGSNGETSVTATANGLVGPYNVTASTSGVGGTASFSLSNTKHAVTLAVTPNAISLAYGQPVTITASMTPSTVQGTVPTGSMTFYDGAATLSPTATVANAAASHTVSVPTVGSHTYAATYSGDTNFQASAQTTGPAVMVNKASSTLSGPTSTTVGYGQSGSIAIAIAGQFSGTGIATPSGSIGYAISGTAVSGSSPITSGAATIPVPNALAAGSYTVSITYAGDTNYSAAASISVPLTIAKANATVTLGNLSQTFTGSPLPVTVTTNPASLSVSVTYNGSTTVPTNAGSYTVVATVTDPTYSGSATGTLVIGKTGSAVALTSSTSSANLNANVTFTATVTSQTGGTPTGGVQFLDGSAVLGTGPINNQGVATYTTSSLTTGLHKITAVYQGDANFTGSTSAALAQIVIAPAFSLSSSTTTLTLKAGQTGKVTISMIPVGGFKGSIQFDCAGLPNGSKCAFSPATLTADGSNTTQTSTLTINTQGSNTGTVAMAQTGKPDGVIMAGFFWLPALFFGGFLFWQRKKLTQKYRVLLILLVAAATISGAVGCGSSTPIVPTGTSTVIVRGSTGSSSQVATLYLKITK